MATEPWTVTGYLATLLLLAGSAPPPSAGGLQSQQVLLADGVAGIRHADYAGERAELRRLAAAMDEVTHRDLAPFREYWAGFALWRRALNGFNDDTPPEELRADLESAVAAFRRALQHEPGWLEPKVGLAGCGANLLYLAGTDAARRDALLAEFVPVFREMAEQGRDNPRALWIVGGGQLSAPPPRGGHPDLAAATYRAALEAARAEALARPDQPAWVPSWGAPENLMSLAYVYTHTPLKNRELALAYAEGALAAVPHWRYVRDILLPQTRAMASTP
jgi:hypothetical protein